MKLFRLLVFCGALVAGIGSTQAQDIHFTMYDMTPVWLNASNTGGFRGSVRLGGIYRNQWFGLLSNGASYSTFTVHADAPIIRGFRPLDWVGAGIVFSRDQAGTFNLGRTMFLGSAAYHFALDKKRNGILALGLQYGATNFRMEQPFADEVVGPFDFVNAINFTNNEATSSSNVLNAGLSLRSRLNENANMQIGFSLYNILEGDYSIVSGGGVPGGPGPGPGPVIPDVPEEREYPTRFGVHGRFDYQLSEKISIHPSIFYHSLRNNREMQIQSMVGYFIRQGEKPIRLKAGLGYRVADAVELMLGAEINDLTVGMAYDLTTSDLADASSAPGTVEIAASYILKIYKEPSIPPALFCPRF